MSFSGRPLAPVSQPVSNPDPFYPDLDIVELQTVYRVPIDYSPELLAESLTVAMLEINADLNGARARWIAAGQSELDSAQTALYRRAVLCRAKSYLLTQFATVVARPAANNEGKSAPERADTFITLSGQALRLLQGRGRIGVRLI